MNQFQMDSAKECCMQEQQVAMAYIPWQTFTKAYEPQRALQVGTIFPELDKPFTGRAGGMRK